VCEAALAATLVGALALPALAAKDDLDLVSRATGGAAAAGGGSFNTDISADGRFVAFTSLRPTCRTPTRTSSSTPSCATRPPARRR